jgi:PTH1 family peptidyl-tRNA hydrolase
MIKLAAFLGNPGSQYARNRHNAGRLLVRSLPFFEDLAWRKKFQGLCAEVSARAEAPLPTRPVFIMPETFMNDSGRSIAEAASFYKLKPEEVLVVHDELELELGMLSFKFGGGLGGHNGLRSTKGCLGTADFWRLRIGIGRPGDRVPGKGGDPGKHGDIAGWVLSDFRAADEALLQATLAEAGRGLMEALQNGPETMLPAWAKRKVAF